MLPVFFEFPSRCLQPFRAYFFDQTSVFLVAALNGRLRCHLNLCNFRTIKLNSRKTPAHHIKVFPYDQGYYIRPTVVTGVDDECDLMRQEIFGPVVCLTTFDAEEEVVRRANHSGMLFLLILFYFTLGLFHT